MAVSMPVLRRIYAGGKKYEDVVLLNINHDMKNTYCFSAELRNIFGKVIQVGVSYTSSTAEERKVFEGGIYYYAVRNRDGPFPCSGAKFPCGSGHAALSIPSIC